MGCSLQKNVRIHAKEVIGHDPSDENNPLTDRQRHLVQRTWRILADDMTGRGVMVFLHIFEHYPDLRVIFPFRDTPLDVLSKDPQFRGHSSRFMQAMGAAVDNVGEWEEKLTPLLLQLGKQHAYMAGFDLKFFDVFADIMMEIWSEELGAKFNEEVDAAWRVVLGFLMDRLRDGYLSIKSVDEGNSTCSSTPIKAFEEGD